MHLSERTYVTRGELASELHVSKATIRQWELLRGFPQPLPGSGRVPLYKTADVAAWLEGAEGDQP